MYNIPDTYFVSINNKGCTILSRYLCLPESAVKNRPLAPLHEWFKDNGFIVLNHYMDESVTESEANEVILKGEMDISVWSKVSGILFFPMIARGTVRFVGEDQNGNQGVVYNESNKAQSVFLTGYAAVDRLIYMEPEVSQHLRTAFLCGQSAASATK